MWEKKNPQTTTKKQDEGKKKCPATFFSLLLAGVRAWYTHPIVTTSRHVAESPKTQFCLRLIGLLPAAEQRAGPSLRPCFPKPGRALKIHAAVCLGVPRGHAAAGEVLASLRGGDCAVSGVQPGPHPGEPRDRSLGGKGRRDSPGAALSRFLFNGRKTLKLSGEGAEGVAPLALETRLKA